MAIRLTLITSLVFSAIIPVNASAKEPIFTNEIGETRKLLYGEKEKFISCWTVTKGTVYLDVKVKGKWKQKAKTSLRKDAKNCSDKEYPGASKLVWTPDELSTIRGTGRTYILEIRERYGSNIKSRFTWSFTIPIYSSSSDLINDLVDQLPTTPTQTQPVLPTRTPTPTSVPTPSYTPIPVPTYTRTPTPTFTPTPTNKLAGCTYKGKKLFGKVQVVDFFPDIKVQVVDFFPDLKVQRVDFFPTSCGKWQFVDFFPDIKVQFVDFFPGLP